MTVPIFICHSAEDAAAYDYLVRHLRPLVNNKRARVCSSRSVLPGEPRAARIRREIHEARLILFLVSANLVASDDIESVELPESLARAEVARLIPIIVSDCLWQHTRLGHLNAIPRERGRLRAEALVRPARDERHALLKRLAQDKGASVMLVTHDMGVIAETCDRVAVMYAGRIVEIGPVADVIHRPAHPYTVGLMGSIPAMDQDRDRLLQIDGAMPRLNAIPAGCAFNPRCPRVFDRCRVERPDLIEAGATRAACWLLAGHGATAS